MSLPNEQTTPIVYTVEQAMKALGVGKSKLYEELNAGRIKAKKSGHRTLIPHASIQEWLANLPDFAPPNPTDDAR